MTTPPPQPPIGYDLRPPEMPKAWKLYRVLLVVLVLMQGAIFAMGMWVRNNAQWIADQDPDRQTSVSMLVSYGNTLIWSGVIFALLNIALFFLPRKPWAYGIHLTNAIAGIAMCCPAPLAIWVLVLMCKPEAKRWYDA